jgi:hypothetical protein
VFVFDKRHRLAKVVLDNQKVEINRRTIETPLSMPFAYFLIAPTCALLPGAVFTE